ncbi:MAG TPA: hypothetical protein VLB84_03500, partial [Bacteroidia bacterium]|nr:hypothetical protein [Bacteroidia bacterium]
DTLVKKDGTQVLGKVLEVSITEVKYKKAELPDGPVYIEDKAIISKIKYQGGFVDLFPEPITQKSIHTKIEENNDYVKSEPKYPPLSKLVGTSYLYNGQMIRERQMHDVLLKLNDPEISRRVRAARLSKGLRYIGFAAIPLFTAAMACGIYALNGNYTADSKKIGFGLLAGAGVVFGTSIYFNINYRFKNMQAVRLYQLRYMSKN